VCVYIYICIYDIYIYFFPCSETLGATYLYISYIGHQLVNTSGEGIFNPTLQLCSPCGPNKYIIDQSAPCQDCAKGAVCPDGAQFLPIAIGSEWEQQAASNGGIQHRIVKCPPGYALEREEPYPNADNCLACEPTFYRLEPAYVNSSLPHCIPCNAKAVCRGADIVESIEGYWRFAPELWDTAYEYLPGTECLIEGAVCLFPDSGWTLLSGWDEETMSCIKVSPFSS
jgi:hypothetical protein